MGPEREVPPLGLSPSAPQKRARRIWASNGTIAATFPDKLEMRLPLWSWRPLRPRWSYTSANAELALNGLLRFGTALCTSVLASRPFQLQHIALTVAVPLGA